MIVHFPLDLVAVLPVAILVCRRFDYASIHRFWLVGVLVCRRFDHTPLQLHNSRVYVHTTHTIISPQDVQYLRAVQNIREFNNMPFLQRSAMY